MRSFNKAVRAVGLAVFAALAGLSISTTASAVTVNVSGTVNWTDGQGGLHPTRLDQVQVVGTNSITGSFVAGTGTCDQNGNYNISFNSLAPVANTYQLQVMPSNAAGYVTSDGTAANTYVIPTPTFNLAGGNNTVNFNVPNNSDGQTQSLSVADSVLTAYQFATDSRPAAPAAVPIQFYSTGSFYDTKKGILNIDTTDGYDWDVINHEYGHNLQNVDNIAVLVGGDHDWGTTNIGLVQDAGKPTARTLTKLQGVELAWSEGSASFIGVASQFNNPAGYNRPNLQNVGDTYFDDFNEVNFEGKPKNTSYNLAGFDKGTQINNGTINYTTVQAQGEGDELAVGRILWSISDTTGQSWDRVNRGPTQVYKDMLAARVGGTLQSLSQLNNYYINTVSANDKQRTDFGAIFQHYGVSPNPNGALAADPTLSNTDPAPTFTWDVGNFNANDTFRLIIWSDTGLTNRVIDNFLIPQADGNSYTLTAAQWALVDATAGTKEFVITGSDLIDPTGTAYAADSVTGAYWSDAFPFEVTVPEPGVFALMVMGTSMMFLRRRRVAA